MFSEYSSVNEGYNNISFLTCKLSRRSNLAASQLWEQLYLLAPSESMKLAEGSREATWYNTAAYTDYVSIFMTPNLVMLNIAS